MHVTTKIGVASLGLLERGACLVQKAINDLIQRAEFSASLAQ